MEGKSGASSRGNVSIERGTRWNAKETARQCTQRSTYCPRYVTHTHVTHSFIHSFYSSPPSPFLSVSLTFDSYNCSPAPIAYINVVAVKKFVVEFLADTDGLTLSVCAFVRVAILGWSLCGIRLSRRGCPSFTVRK